MARVSKAPHVRRDELLDVALRLCAEVGYESLNIDQLTREVGVAKGTFYYHFPTKADMLIALVNRFVDDLFVDLEAFSTKVEGTGQQRFRQLLTESATWKTARLDDAFVFIPLLYKPENLELRHRLFESWIARIHDLFLPLITLGAEDGSFDLPEGTDPEILTVLVMTLWIDGSTGFFERALKADTPDAFADILARGIKGLATAVERVLGAAPGSFEVPYEPGILLALHGPFVAALNGFTAPDGPTPEPTNTSTNTTAAHMATAQRSIR